MTTPEEAVASEPIDIGGGCEFAARPVILMPDYEHRILVGPLEEARVVQTRKASSRNPVEAAKTLATYNHPRRPEFHATGVVVVEVTRTELGLVTPKQS